MVLMLLMLMVVDELDVEMDDARDSSDDRESGKAGEHARSWRRDRCNNSRAPQASRDLLHIYTRVYRYVCGWVVLAARQRTND